MPTVYKYCFEKTGGQYYYSRHIEYFEMTQEDYDKMDWSNVIRVDLPQHSVIAYLFNDKEKAEIFSHGVAAQYNLDKYFETMIDNYIIDNALKQAGFENIQAGLKVNGDIKPGFEEVDYSDGENDGESG